MYGKFNNNDIMYAVAAFVVISTVLLISVFTPLVIFLVLFLPLPLMVVYHKMNYKTYVGLVIISIACFILVFGFFGLFVGAYVFGLGTIYGFYTVQKKPVFSTLKAGSIGMILLFAGFLLGIQVFYEVNLLQETGIMLEQAVNTQASYLKEANAPQSQIEELKQVPDLYSEYVKPLIPSGLIISTIILSFVHCLLGYKILDWSGIKNSNAILPFKFWKFPSYLSIVFILSILGFLLIGDSQTLIGIFTINLFNLLTYALLIQGASLVYWFLREKYVGKIFSVLGVILLFVLPPLSFLLLFIGVCDLTFNFRKI